MSKARPHLLDACTHAAIRNPAMARTRSLEIGTQATFGVSRRYLVPGTGN